jgi:hypothetical protein
MTDESRPDDPTPLTREAIPPRRDRWLMPLIAAGCTLAGVAVGFVMGQSTAQSTRVVPGAVIGRGDDQVFKIDVNHDDDDDRGAFAFNWRGRMMPPIPPMPPMGPRELVVNNCGDDDDEDGCTTIIKRKQDGSVVIVKTRRPAVR